MAKDRKQLAMGCYGSNDGDAEASDQFMAFMTGQQTPDQTAEMMLNLHEYCGQDVMAMVRLLDVVQRLSDQ